MLMMPESAFPYCGSYAPRMKSICEYALFVMSNAGPPKT